MPNHQLLAEAQQSIKPITLPNGQPAIFETDLFEFVLHGGHAGEVKTQSELAKAYKMRV